MVLTSKISTQFNHAPLTWFFEGTAGNDTLNGTQDADTIYGRGGHDTINGGFGNDFLYGEGGNDTLYGGSGNDQLDGGIGNDVLVGGSGADTLIGGSGADTVSYRGAGAGVMLDLGSVGITNDAAGDTYSGIENVWGTGYGDIIQGDAQANQISGYFGDDFLAGGAGNDFINGGAGADTIRGGAGNDILMAGGGGPWIDRMTGDDAGQVGNDTFVFWGGTGYAPIVTDFQHGHDLLDVSFFAQSGTPFGSDGRLAIGSAATGWANLDAGDEFAFDTSTHTLTRIVSLTSDGHNVDWNQPIAVLQDVDTLSASDLTLVSAIPAGVVLF